MSAFLNSAKEVLTISKYCCMITSLAWYSPLICNVTKYESNLIITYSSPIMDEILKLGKNASYSTWLFEMENLNLTLTSILTNFSFSSISTTSIPFTFDYLSTNNIHLVDAFGSR